MSMYLNRKDRGYNILVYCPAEDRKPLRILIYCKGALTWFLLRQGGARSTVLLGSEVALIN